MNRLSVIILAAGEGTRMKSSIPKVLHQLEGKPMLIWVLETVTQLHPSDIFVVVSKTNRQAIQEHLKEISNIVFVTQIVPRGTADAVKCTIPEFKDTTGDCLILYGDTPLLSITTLEKMRNFHYQYDNTMTLLTAHLENPFSYGRILRNPTGNIIDIVEEKELTEEQAKITEINVGVYYSRILPLFTILPQVRNNNTKQEYYFTDTVNLLTQNGYRVDGLVSNNSDEWMGINTPEELQRATEIIKLRYYVNR